MRDWSLGEMFIYGKLLMV